RAVAWKRDNEKIRKQREAAVNLLNRIGLSINESLELGDALEAIAAYIVESTQAEAGAVFLLDPGARELHARTVVGPFPPMRPTSRRKEDPETEAADRVWRETIAVGEGVIGFVAEHGEAVLISDAWNDPRVPQAVDDRDTRIYSMIAAPMSIRQRTVGVFAVVNKLRGSAFDESDLALLEQLSLQAALTVDIVRLYARQAEQSRIEEELKLAREFQRMLLPRELPEADGLDLAGFSEPALEVGGDYYDVFWVKPGEALGVAVVDASGKGIRGALVVALLR
ncbi:unnamed protein product, partial [marine sediment metagenome]